MTLDGARLLELHSSVSVASGMSHHEYNSLVPNSFVPSDFLVDGQVSGLGTVHPLLTISFVSTWILSLHVVSSTLKRKSSSSVMDGLKRERQPYSSEQQ